MLKVNLQGAGSYCGGLPHSLLDIKHSNNYAYLPSFSRDEIDFMIIARQHAFICIQSVLFVVPILSVCPSVRLYNASTVSIKTNGRIILVGVSF